MAASDENEELESFVCSICLEIYENPVVIPCGNNHIVCSQCIESVIEDEEPKCTQCRMVFNPNNIQKNDELHVKMEKSYISCFGCNTKFLVIQMKEHLSTCDKIDRHINYFKPVKETTQHIPHNLPNRSTFQCPYCGLQNLDLNGLLKHCNVEHVTNTAPVVCPVCVSMPWGEQDLHSSNFIQHLNMRHKFDYSTYVDYAQDDDAMLQAALAASMTNS